MYIRKNKINCKHNCIAFCCYFLFSLKLKIYVWIYVIKFTSVCWFVFSSCVSSEQIEWILDIQILEAQ